jgi:putative phage-type endonuclease
MTTTTTIVIEKELWKLVHHLPNVMQLETNDHIAGYLAYVTKQEVSLVLPIVERIRSYRAILHELRKMPQVAQRSPEWYDLRRNRLTASDTAQAIGKSKFGKNRAQLVQKKAFPELDSSGYSMSIPPLRWGVMFEPMASRCYSQRHGDIVLHEFGLIPHPSLSCFGASPDGITDLGIMVEFKCPWKRKIDGIIPEQYFIQMQGQMAVCRLQECDYVECDMQEYNTEGEYRECVGDGITVDHGVIVETGTREAPIFAYSPPYLTKEETLAWAHEQPHVYLHFWRLRKIHIARVPFDECYWDLLAQQIAEFWQEVEHARSSDATQGTGKRKEPEKYDFIQDDDS